MLGKRMRVAFIVWIYAIGVGGCSKKGDPSQNPSDDYVFVQSKEIVVAHGQAGGADNPPCIRHGLEDVLPAAKGFATDQKSVSYSLVGKDTPVAAVALENPKMTRGVSMVVRNVEEELKNLGPESAKDLQRQPYSSCATVAFFLPTNMKQVRTVVSVGGEDGTLQPCNVAENNYTKCPVEQAAWISFHENRYLVVTFKNWSDNANRAVKIEITP